MREHEPPMTDLQKKLQQNAQRALNNQTNIVGKPTVFGNASASTSTSASMLATGPDYNRPQACPPRRCAPNPCDGIEWWRIQCMASKFFAELVGTFMIGIVLAIGDLYVFAGEASPGRIVQAFAIAAIATGLRYAFIQFHAGHFNPAYTFLQWCCDRKRWDWYCIGDHLILLLGQFLGFLFAAWLVSAITPAPLSCTVILPAFGNGFGFLFESLAILFLIHVFVLAVHRKNSGMYGVLGLGLAEFASIAALAPVTGGSINFFRSLGTALVQGAPCTTSLGIYVGAMFAAIVVSIVFLLWIFPAKCASTNNTVTIEVPPPQMVCDNRGGDEQKNY